MAAGPLFRDTDMAAVTSRENTLLLQGRLKLMTCRRRLFIKKRRFRGLSYQGLSIRALRSRVLIHRSSFPRRPTA